MHKWKSIENTFNKIISFKKIWLQLDNIKHIYQILANHHII